MSPFSGLSKESNGIRNCNRLSGSVPWSDEIISFCTGVRRQHKEITKHAGHNFCGDIVRRHLFRDIVRRHLFRDFAGRQYFRGFAGRHFFGELVRAPPLRGHVYISKRCLSKRIWRKHFCFVFLLLFFWDMTKTKWKKKIIYYIFGIWRKQNKRGKLFLSKSQFHISWTGCFRYSPWARPSFFWQIS